MASSLCVHPRPQGLYSGELSNIDDNGIWTGYDIDLLDKLAGLGGFTYSTVHVGKAAEIEAGEMSYTNRAKWLLGVTYVRVAAAAASTCTRAHHASRTQRMAPALTHAGRVNGARVHLGGAVCACVWRHVSDGQRGSGVGRSSVTCPRRRRLCAR